jgi:hypothetical protein
MCFGQVEPKTDVLYRHFAHAISVRGEQVLKRLGLMLFQRSP